MGARGNSEPAVGSGARNTRPGGRGQRSPRVRGKGIAVARALVAVALVSRALFAQEGSPLPPKTPPGAPQAVPAGTLTVDDKAKPTAAEILAKAIAAQGLPPVADPAADVPLALHAKVSLQYRDGQGSDVNVEAERKFLGPSNGPSLLWTKVRETFAGSEAIEAFDGQVPWSWNPKTGIVLLDDAEHASDREKIVHDLEQTANLARVFLLRNLPGQLTDLRRLVPDAEAFGIKAWVIEGDGQTTAVDGARKKVKLKLWINQANAWLMGANVSSVDEPEPELQICFTRHEVDDGVVVPRKIELYYDKHTEPDVTLQVKFLRFAPKLEPKDFAPPKE